MGLRRINNEIVIQCSPQAVYDYVTQPWRWHEWHPSSQSATATAEVLSAGDSFDEVICLHPVSPLPLTIRRHTHYQVVLASPPTTFEVHGDAGDGGLTIHYDLHPHGEGTLFSRTLEYEVRGLMQVIEPVLLYPRMRRLSAQALNNLKVLLESR